MEKIVLSNCWSYYNKGDAAITWGTINILKKKYPESKISLLAFDNTSFQNRKELKNVNVYPMPASYTPLNWVNLIMIILCHILPGNADTFAWHYIRFQIGLLRIFRHLNPQLKKMLRVIDEADLFVSVGGNYLWSHPGLYNHLIPIIYSKEMKKKTIFYGHSIGPFNNNHMREKLVELFDKIDIIYTREDISYNYLKNELKLKNDNIFLLGDIAFIIDKNDEVKKQENNNICITVRPWLYNETTLNAKYINSIKEIIIFLVNTNKFYVTLLPFSYAPGKEYDLDVCQLIYSKLPEEVKYSTSILDVKEKSPSDIIQTLQEKNFTILIGTRLHSVILASLASIPSVIISYQHFKAFGISKQLGLENYVIKIEDLNVEELKSLTMRLLRDRENIRGVIIQSVKKIRENIASNSDFDKKFIN